MSKGTVMTGVTEEAALEIKLPAQLDQKAAYALAETLLAERGRPARLDGAAVQRLGGQSLQVLLAARHAWAQDAQDFVLVQSSAALMSGLALFGAAEMFVFEEPAGADDEREPADSDQEWCA